MHKVVLDTNIYISSVSWEKGNPHKIIEKAIEKKVKVIASDEILGETAKIMKRDFNESDSFIKKQINFIKKYAEIIETEIKIDIVKEDPDDNKIIECAIEGKADYIVS